MKEATMAFPQGGLGPVRVVGKTVEFDTADRRWVSRPIRIHTGKRKAVRT